MIDLEVHVYGTPWSWGKKCPFDSLSYEAINSDCLSSGFCQIRCIDVTLKDTDIAKALIEYANYAAIERLVLGNSRGGFFRCELLVSNRKDVVLKALKNLTARKE